MSLVKAKQREGAVALSESGTNHCWEQKVAEGVSKKQEGQMAKRKRQMANSKSEDARAGRITFDIQPGTFDFLKNEATDLLDNKGSGPEKNGNEATVECSRQSAEGSHQVVDEDRAGQAGKIAR